MKKPVLVALVLLAAGSALAVAPYVNEQKDPTRFRKGVAVGPSTTSSTSNLVTKVLGNRCSYDYPAIGGTSTSLLPLAAYSFPCTVTGARVGDLCFANSFEGADAGVGTGDGGNPFRQELILTCNVTAPDTVKGRLAALMSDGGSIDLPDASYSYGVISFQ